MKLETINGIRVITPMENMWLCNKADRIISDKVYLGINADETMWEEITETEKANFEVLWNAEILPETEATETSNYEKIIDILTGVDE